VVDWLELHEPMTRRRALLLGVGAAMTTVLAACGTASVGGTADAGEPTSAASTGTEPGGTGGTTIRMIDGNAFDPPHLTVRVGDEVTWENASSSVHTATCDPDNPMGVEHTLPEGAETFNSGKVSPGESFSHTFDVAGEYAYSCMLHLRMTGHVTVAA
jgi:plastocyanin